MFKFFLFAACALTHHTYLYATCKRHVVKGQQQTTTRGQLWSILATNNKNSVDGQTHAHTDKRKKYMPNIWMVDLVECQYLIDLLAMISIRLYCTTLLNLSSYHANNKTLRRKAVISVRILLRDRYIRPDGLSRRLLPSCHPSPVTRQWPNGAVGSGRRVGPSLTAVITAVTDEWRMALTGRPGSHGRLQRCTGRCDGS